jgi:hypothetical protein
LVTINPALSLVTDILDYFVTGNKNAIGLGYFRSVLDDKIVGGPVLRWDRFHFDAHPILNS